MIKALTNWQPKYEAFDFEEKRVHERIPVEIDTRYFYGNMFYSGKVSNLSEAGMFINTKKCLPFGAVIIVTIRNENEHLRTVARVRRVQRSREDCDGLGLELLRPTGNYLDFVKKLKTTDQQA